MAALLEVVEKGAPHALGAPLVLLVVEGHGGGVGAGWWQVEKRGWRRATAGQSRGQRQRRRRAGRSSRRARGKAARAGRRGAGATGRPSVTQTAPPRLQAPHPARTRNAVVAEPRRPGRAAARQCVVRGYPKRPEAAFALQASRIFAPRLARRTISMEAPPARGYPGINWHLCRFRRRPSPERFPSESRRARNGQKHSVDTDLGCAAAAWRRPSFPPALAATPPPPRRPPRRSTARPAPMVGNALPTHPPNRSSA